MKKLILIMLLLVGLNSYSRTIFEPGVTYSPTNTFFVRPELNLILSEENNDITWLTYQGFVGMGITEFNELSFNAGGTFIFGDKLFDPFITLQVNSLGYKTIIHDFMPYIKVGIVRNKLKLFGTYNWIGEPVKVFNSKTNTYVDGLSPKPVLTFGISYRL